jgi:hypothetical protein
MLNPRRWLPRLLVSELGKGTVETFKLIGGISLN